MPVLIHASGTIVTSAYQSASTPTPKRPASTCVHPQKAASHAATPPARSAHRSHGRGAGGAGGSARMLASRSPMPYPSASSPRVRWIRPMDRNPSSPATAAPT